MTGGLLSDLGSALDSLQARVGRVSEGGKEMKRPPTLEVLTKFHGDYALTVSYAGLFAPDIWMKEGIPFARFSPDDPDGSAIDVFHVDLLHCCDAESSLDVEVLRAIGRALAFFWSRQLADAGVSGSFRYDDSTGHDVVFVAPVEPEGVAAASP